MEKSAKNRKISVFKLWVLSDFTIVRSGFSSDFTIRQKTQAKLGCRSDLKKFQTHESSGFLLLVCCGCWFIALCIHFAFELLRQFTCTLMMKDRKDSFNMEHRDVIRVPAGLLFT
ncbi:uncharacterized protein [Malus domestica]|uniref:uncharacterized protein isoform X2 n=1 Tax=Malus domestica TaxID=3750 RepID=UPI003976E976